MFKSLLVLFSVWLISVSTIPQGDSANLSTKNESNTGGLISTSGPITVSPVSHETPNKIKQNDQVTSNPNGTTTSTTETPPITTSSITTPPTTTVPTTSSTTPSPTTHSTPPSSTHPSSTSTLPPITTSGPPKPEPGLNLPSFLGGLILGLGLIAIGYVVYKFYKQRDMSYRTL